MKKLLLFSSLLLFVGTAGAQTANNLSQTPASPNNPNITRITPAQYKDIRRQQSNLAPKAMNGQGVNTLNPEKPTFQTAPLNQQVSGNQTITKGGPTPPAILANGDQRNLPLDVDGDLTSVDGFKVEFNLPKDTNISHVCGTHRPQVIGAPKDINCPFVVPCDDPANRDAVNTTTIDYFQLVWHVMLDGGPSSNIDQNRIDQLMAELNADYASANMIFCADPATFTEDPANWDHNSATEEFSLKAAYNVTPTQVINIYVVGTMTAGGYARFPYDPNGGTNANGGIVLNRSNCWIGSHTLAHEMGHTMGLEHTFAGVDERADCSNCYEKVRNVNGSSNTSGVGTPLGGPYTNEGDREGDWCSDTNPHDTNSGVCATSGAPNNGCDSNPWNNAPVNNHMSYSFCSTQFTDQQRRRMHCMSDSYLGSWQAYGGGVCGSQPPVADFVGTPTTWQAPSIVNFTDQSLPSALVTGWTWTFDVGASNTVTCVGCTGTNAQFVGQTPPAVTYPNPGLYTVSLTITSANGPDTETKVDYIEVLAPSGDCDTLTTQWETPTPTVITYGFGGGWITGVPDPANSILPTDPKGIYEGYFSPNPGTTPVGAVRVGMGSLRDDDDDMTFQVVVYDDDGFGAPGAIVGGVGGISPTQLGVPGPGFYNEFWVPFPNAPIPTTAFFHVGVEIFPSGDATDTLIVMTSCLGPTGCAVAQGETDASNTIWTSGFGYENLLTVYGADLDVDIIPMLGEYDPLPYIEFFTETVVCDTTYVTIHDSVLYSIPTGWSFIFADGTVINATTDPETIDRVYTSAGPDTVTIATINACGRGDTTTWIIPYNFLSTPDAEFTKTPPNPICAGAPGVDFTANTTGYFDYTWDFGDGTVLSSGTSNTINHVYATPGLYYVSLTTTEDGFQPLDTFYLEDFESGWPAGYARFDNDPFTPNAGVNPPFTGTNATAWLDLDVDGSGDFEAVSTSWNGPAEQGDDWMLTTGIGVLPANQVLYWDAEAQSIAFPDGYEVRISTTAQLPATVGNYNTVLFSTTGENGYITTRNTSLAAYAGQTVYIAFRNNSTDMFLLSIDNIRVGTASPGCFATVTKPDFVEVVDCSVIPPTAVLAADVTQGCAPLTVTFTDATVAGDPATSWLWNFGDGGFSTLQNPPPHVYTAAGNYFVSFQACNTGGCSTDFVTINVGTPPTISNIATTDPTCVGGDGQIVVTAGAGGTPPLQYSNDNGVTFQASNTFGGLNAGTFDIVVEDSYGCQATSSVTLNPAPIPNITNVAVTDPDCNGALTGSIVITAGGGTAPLQYSIDNGVTFQASNTFNTLGAAGYNIVVEDASGCQATTTATLTDPSAVSITNVAVTDPDCAGALTGSIVITASGGTGAITYSINGGGSFQGSNTFNTLGAGPYSIVVQDANNCQATTTATLTDPPAVSITNVATTDPSCNGDTDGSIVITASGGTGALTYSIDNGVTFQASNTFNTLGAAGYNIVVEDANGCQATTTATLTNPSAVAITNVAVTQPTCNGATDGSIVITASGGTGALTYSIDNGVTFQASNTFNTLGAAGYNIVVEDANGCQATTTATLTNPTAVSITNVATVDPTCNGATDGSITITASGGTAPLQYSIDNGVTFQAGNNFGSLGAGGYNIVVEDANGCQATTTATLTAPASVNITNVATVDPTCNGGTDGSITITASGGTAPLQYSIDNGVTFQASNVFNSLGANTYNIVVEDASGCQATTSATLNDPAAVTYTVVITNENCGAGDGQLDLTGGGGDGGPYTYSIDNGVTFQASGTFGSLSAGAFNIVVEDASGCQITGSETVSGNGGPTITGITADVPLNCFGDCNGQLTVTVTGGTPPYTYAWVDGSAAPVGGNSATITGLCASNYTVTVTDAGGGTVNFWNEDFGLDAACANQNQLATVAPSTNGAWTQTILAAEGGVPNQWFVSATEAFTGTSNCGDGCLGNPALDNQTLHVGSLGVGLCPSGDCGAAYNAGGTGETHKRVESPTIDCSAQATTITLSFDYMHFGEVGLDQASLVYFDGATWSSLTTPLPQTTCCGGPCGSLLAQGQWSPTRFSIALPASAQSNANVRIGFVWDNNSNNSGADPSFAVDDIILSSVGGAGCPDVASFNLTQPTAVSYTATVVNENCGQGNGSITITASGGDGGPYTYSNDNGVTFQAGNAFGSLNAAAYNIVVEDGSGCQGSGITTVNSIAGPSISNVATTDPTCGATNGSITITAGSGTAPLTYSIDNGVTFQAGNNFASLGPNTYNIVVQDAAGCQATTTATLTDPGAPIISNVAVVDPSCNGATDGSITITAGGGTAPLSYSIDNGVTFQASNTFNTLGAAGYNIVVEDAVGCQATTTATLTDPPAVVISNVATTDPTCGNTDGSITITAGGGTGALSYSIDNGVTFQAGNTFNSLGAATYMIVVEDANGCQATTTATLNNAGAPSITNVATTDPTCGNNNGDITITASGGTAPLNYSIDNGVTFQVGNNFTGLGPNTYLIVVEDALGCQASTSVTLTDPGSPTISNVATTDPTCGNTNGDITITATGGTTPYNYSIDNGVTFQAGNNFTGLAAASYNIVVEDANGCQVTTLVTLTDPGSPVINVINSTDPTCGNADGTITITASGGTAPLNYSIDNGVTFQAGNGFTGLAAAAYSVVVEDANGCQVTGSITLNNAGAPTINSVTANDPTCGLNNGSISINATGGTPPLNYSIDNGVTFQTGSLFNGLGTGTYDVVVEDANGCQSSQQVILTDPGAPSISNIATVDPTCGGSNGSITVTATGGVTPYQYSNDGGTTFQAGNAFTGLAGGSYTVVVEDANGCQVSQTLSLTNVAAPSITGTVLVDPSCGNNDGSIQINATGGTAPLNYSIDGGTTFQAGSTFTGLGANTYNLVVEDANGCQATASVTLNNSGGIAFDSIPTTDAPCFGMALGTADIYVSGGTAPYGYSIDGGVTFVGSNSFTNLAAGNYNVTVTDANGCTGTSTFIINEPSALTSTISTDMTICEGETVNLSILGSGGTPGYVYAWSCDQPDCMLDDPNSSTPTATPTVTTTYFAQVTDANLCTSPILSVTITVNPSPIVNAGADVTITAGGSTMFTPTPSGAASYAWTPGATLDDPNIENPTATPTSTTTYTVTVTDGNGCIGSDDVIVTVEDSELEIPTGFTPDNDGANDKWNIKNSASYPEMRVEIRNRWGNLLFESVGYTDPWDGTYKGDPLPTGSYYYIIDLGDDETEPFTGTITIIR